MYTNSNVLRSVERTDPTARPARHRKRCLISFSSALYTLHSVQCCFLPWTPYRSLAYPCHSSSHPVDADLASLSFRKLRCWFCLLSSLWTVSGARHENYCFRLLVESPILSWLVAAIAAPCLACALFMYIFILSFHTLSSLSTYVLSLQFLSSLHNSVTCFFLFSVIPLPAILFSYSLSNVTLMQ